MKITHLTSVHPRTDTRIFVKQCCSLAKDGHQVSLIVADGKGDEILNEVHIIDVGASEGRFDRFFNTTKRVFERAKEIHSDVFHFHDPELIPVGLKLKKIGKKVIFDAHEDVPRQILAKPYIPKMLRHPVSFLFEKFENYSTEKFDAVVCATPVIEERFNSQGHRAVNVSNYPIVSELGGDIAAWDKKESAVCYVGSLTRVRGIFEMVDAIGLADSSLLMGGCFGRESEKEQASLMSGWHNVEYAGFLNREGVANILSRSMAGLVVLHPTANYLESLPVKMFEYMCAGIPVIASNFPLWQSIISENSCGLCVDPLNTHEIAEGIQWILDHPEEAQVMGENGKHAVESLFNWEKEFSKLKELYLELS